MLTKEQRQEIRKRIEAPIHRAHGRDREVEMSKLLEKIGWFDDAMQQEPSYDPPHDGPCIICDLQLCAPMVTISLMAQDGAKRCYFYRAHKLCYGSNKDTADNTALAIIRQHNMEADTKVQ